MDCKNQAGQVAANEHLVLMQSLPRHRKAPKEKTGTALVSALDRGDVTINGQAAAIGAMPSPGSLEPPEGQNCSSHEASSIAPVADETGLQGSSSGVQAGVSDPESANNSRAELNKRLADLKRKYSELQELHTQANNDPRPPKKSYEARRYHRNLWKEHEISERGPNTGTVARQQQREYLVSANCEASASN